MKGSRSQGQGRQRSLLNAPEAISTFVSIAVRNAFISSLVLLVALSVAPKFYYWIVRFHLKKRNNNNRNKMTVDTSSLIQPKKQVKSLRHVLPESKLDPLYGVFGLRSDVRTRASPESVQLPLKVDGNKDQQQQPFSDLVNDNASYLRDGSWELMSPVLFNGDLQTIYASAPHEDLNQVYYGRRCMYWEDGSLVTADYLIDPPTSPAEWKEQVKYCPLANPPPFPKRLRYFAPEEIHKLQNPDPVAATATPQKPLLILLHGLSGGSHESYIRSAVDQISKPEYGFDCIVLNSRGCARTPITTPQLFCALWTEDIRRFIRLLRSEEKASGAPPRRIYLVGFSLGASILANYLGQEGELTHDPESRVDAAMIMGNPWDLNYSSDYIHSTLMGRYLYSPSMAKNLLKLVKNHLPRLETIPLFDYGKRHEIKLISDFDNEYTAPFFGFDTGKDYYRTASSVNLLMNIRTPTVIVNSLDDPIVGKGCIPYLEAYKNPYVILTTTSLGGHLGWFQPGTDNRWSSKAIAQFFKVFDEKVDHEKGTPIVAVSRPERLFSGDRLQVSKQ